MSIKIPGQSLKQTLDTILPRVLKPARYVGGEWGSASKDPLAVDVRVALAFPDVYEIGMSNLGLRILYHVLNQRADVFAERTFAPWPDMEREMQDAGLPLYALETLTPLSEFDIIGFSLSYEMTFTNILNMLHLAGISKRGVERTNDDPIIIAGGHAAFNPEPMAPFIDAFVLGEGEEVILDMVDALKRTKGDRSHTLIEFAKIPGVYVPSLYKDEYTKDGAYVGTVPTREDIPPVVSKRIIQDFNAVPYPDQLVVPYIEAVHDRAVLEIMRGCTRGCRFCQAGMITRPLREKRRETLENQADRLTSVSGYDEIALTSLSSTDYSEIDPLVHELIDEYEPERIGISLPSLRADSQCVMLAADIERVRKTGLTFAPEAGTQRMRDVINKNVTLDDLLGAVEAAVKAGWRKIKLYFMIGLPTETDEDVLGIIEVIRAVLDRAKQTGRSISINAGVASFVPKPHTPFQWRAQDDIPELERKFNLLKDNMKIRSVNLSWHDPMTGRIEAVLARGDRRVGDAIEKAWELGAKFDGWHDFFSYDRWLDAFEAAGVDPAYYANRARTHEEPLPWDHIDSGISKRYLMVQDRLADKAQPTQDCREGVCTNCGIKALLPPEVTDCWQEIKSRQAEALATQATAKTPSPVGEGRGDGEVPQARNLTLLTFTKGEEIRWLGHLDILRTFERMIRRSKLPLSYSEGFNPRPRMRFASELAVGVTGGAEYLIIELSEQLDSKEIYESLNAVAPPGVKILEVRSLPEDAPKALHPRASEFRVTINGADVDELQKAIAGLLARPEIIVERKKDRRTRAIDIRPGIESLEVESEGPTLVMRLVHGQITPKPVEILAELKKDLPEVELVQIHRSRLFIQ